MSTPRLARRQFVEFRGPSGVGLVRLPGLDGLRGVALIGVLLFHAELGWMVGGFLGVSTFFTLSGFLIGSLLLAECSDTGRIDLRGFWRRRFRRLLPASTFTLFLVATVFALVFATDHQLGELRGEIIASLAQVANWHNIFRGTSYADLFAAPSPVLHFWTLAIEEQFYLLFPLAMFGLWRVTRGRHLTIGITLAVAAAVSAALPWFVTMDRDRVYFGTDTRAAELLLGVLLAVILAQRPVRRRLVAPGLLRDAVIVGGVVCLAVQAWWWWSLPQTNTVLYKGGFAGYALMTCVILTAASLPVGALRRAFGIPLLRWFGERSYGMYLLHWPIYLAVRQTWVDSSPGLRAALSIALSIAAAEVSFRVVEQPIRLGRWPARTAFPRVAGAAVLTVAVVALVVVPSHEADPEGQLDFEQAAQDLDALAAEQRAAQLARERESTTTTPLAAPVPKLGTFGDSTALLVGLGMLQFAAETGVFVGQAGDSTLGCGVSRFESRRVDVEFGYTEECLAWPSRWEAAVAADQPDVVQLITGAWEVTDAKVPGAEDYSALGDPEVDAYVKSELLTAVDVLGSSGALVLVVLWPVDSRAAANAKGAGQRAASDPARMERLHELMREVAAERSEFVKILDLAGHVADRIEDTDLRPDGRHIPAEQVHLLYQQWLGAETIRLWTEHWRATADQG